MREIEESIIPSSVKNPATSKQKLTQYIRKKTKDGEEIVEFMLKVFRGEIVEGRKPTLKERIEAANWLADRGWGKPTQLFAGDDEYAPLLSVGEDELRQLYSFVIDNLEAVRKGKQEPDREIDSILELARNS